MNFLRHFPTERVTVERPDGSSFEIVALFSPGKLTSEAVSIEISEGFRVVRRLKNGATEKYEVAEVEYSQGFPPEIPAHYNLVLKKAGSAPGAQPSPSIVYNVSGDNARLNVNSTDQSTNVVNVSTAVLFQNLRASINAGIEQPDREVLLARVTALEQSVRTPSYAERYQQFIAQAANHMTILAPFLPALSQMIGQGS